MYPWYKCTVTVLNMHEVHTSAGCPKQGLRVLAAMPTVGEIGSADLYGCRFVKEKSATRLLTNMGLTMECPSQAGKLVRGIGWREQGLSRNSAAKTLAACTQMRIRQRATACASCWFNLARSETWTKDCPRHVSDSTDDAARAGSWGC